MKSYNLLVLLTVLIASPYAFAQIPPCPCDTAELPNGNSGDDIVDILCPGGNLAAGNDSIVNPGEVQIQRPGGEKPELTYLVIDEGSGDTLCSIGEETVGTQLVPLFGAEYQSCRERLIRGCNLAARPIPTLSQWGMIAMAGVLGIIGLIVASRRRKVAA